MDNDACCVEIDNALVCPSFYFLDIIHVFNTALCLREFLVTGFYGIE